MSSHLRRGRARNPDVPGGTPAPGIGPRPGTAHAAHPVLSDSARRSRGSDGQEEER